MSKKFRCKLEYYLKEFDVKDSKAIIYRIYRDSWGEGGEMFYRSFIPWIENPDSNDTRILDCVGLGVYKEIFGEEKLEERREEKKREYRNIFRYVNYLCRKNHAKELFSDPTDIARCEKERQDLVAGRFESDLNQFFGVNSFVEYYPPRYEYEEE